MKLQLQILHMIGLMKQQLQMFVQDRVDEATATNICYMIGLMYRIGLMKLQLQIFVYDRVDETTATNACI